MAELGSPQNLRPLILSKPPVDSSQGSSRHGNGECWPESILESPLRSRMSRGQTRSVHIYSILSPAGPSVHEGCRWRSVDYHRGRVLRTARGRSELRPTYGSSDPSKRRDSRLMLERTLKHLRYRYELSERALVHHAKVAADAMIGKALEIWNDALWLESASKRLAGDEQDALPFALGTEIASVRRRLNTEFPRTLAASRAHPSSSMQRSAK